MFSPLLPSAQLHCYAIVRVTTDAGTFLFAVPGSILRQKFNRTQPSTNSSSLKKTVVATQPPPSSTMRTLPLLTTSTTNSFLNTFEISSVAQSQGTLGAASTALVAAALKRNTASSQKRNTASSQKVPPGSSQKVPPGSSQKVLAMAPQIILMPVTTQTTGPVTILKTEYSDHIGTYFKLPRYSRDGDIIQLQDETLIRNATTVMTPSVPPVPVPTSGAPPARAPTSGAPPVPVPISGIPPASVTRISVHDFIRMKERDDKVNPGPILMGQKASSVSVGMSNGDELVSPASDAPVNNARFSDPNTESFGQLAVPIRCNEQARTKVVSGNQSKINPKHFSIGKRLRADLDMKKVPKRRRTKLQRIDLNISSCRNTDDDGVDVAGPPAREITHLPTTLNKRQIFIIQQPIIKVKTQLLYIPALPYNLVIIPLPTESKHA